MNIVIRGESFRLITVSTVTQSIIFTVPRIFSETQCVEVFRGKCILRYTYPEGSRNSGSRRGKNSTTNRSRLNK